MINGVAHGPMKGTTTCQLHMRSFKDGDDDLHRAVARPRVSGGPATWWSTAAPSTASSQAGGYVSVNTGSAPDANAIPIAEDRRRRRHGRRRLHRLRRLRGGVPERLGMLFTAAKVSHLGLLPQGQPERYRRALQMVAQMDDEGFGHCTQYGECQAACPKEISIDFIARMNRDYLRGSMFPPVVSTAGDGGA